MSRKSILILSVTVFVIAFNIQACKFSNKDKGDDSRLGNATKHVRQKSTFRPEPVNISEVYPGIIKLNDIQKKSTNPDLFMSKDGDIYVTWIEISKGERRLSIIKKNTGSEKWETFDSSIKFNGDLKGHSVAVDREGILHLAFLGEQTELYNIFYAMRDDYGWTLPENLSDSMDYDYPPHMAIGPGGSVHIVWSEYFGKFSGVYYRGKAEGKWSPLEDYQVKKSDDDWLPSLAVDAGGKIHLAFHHIENKKGVSYRTIAGDGTASAPETVFEGDIPAGHAKISLDEGGNPHLFFLMDDGDGNDIFYSRKENGKWQKAVNLSNTKNISLGHEVVKDVTGEFHLFWSETIIGGKQTVIMHIHGKDGKWSTPEKLVETGNYMFNISASLKNDGNIGIVWEDRKGPASDVLFKWMN